MSRNEIPRTLEVLMINPLTDEYSNKVMDLAISVRAISEEPDIANMAACTIFLLGAVNLLRQEDPKSRYDCDKFLGALRSVISEHYPEILEDYFQKCFAKEEREGLAVVLPFPMKT